MRRFFMFKSKIVAANKSIAAEEIVARACENRLQNSKLMDNFIQEMEAKKTGLSISFGDALRLAVDKIKAVIQKILNRQKSFAKEANDIEAIADKLEAIQEQYDKLLMGKETASNASREQQ